jgi:hypothetical protein
VPVEPVSPGIFGQNLQPPMRRIRYAPATIGMNKREMVKKTIRLSCAVLLSMLFAALILVPSAWA